jgi:RNA polymerase sigma-70 factor (ECF subfamily)
VNKQPVEPVSTEEEATCLLRLAREGDIDAFCRAFEPHRTLVHSVARRLVGADDAEDVTMDTFLKAWQGLPGLRRDRGLRAWLCRIARNCALDIIRTRSRRAETGRADGADGIEGVLEQLADPDSTAPDEELARREDGARLARALTLLGEAHRTTVELRYADGLSYGEIAGATGVSIGTVMSRLFYAKKRMRQLMREENTA